MLFFWEAPPETYEQEHKHLEENQVNLEKKCEPPSHQARRQRKPRRALGKGANELTQDNIVMGTLRVSTLERIWLIKAKGPFRRQQDDEE